MPLYKSCSRCLKIHPYNYKCNAGRVWKSPNNKEAKLRNSYKWHKKSEQIREASKFLCAVCFDKGVCNYSDLEVHHIEKLRDAPDKLLDNANLICLCQSCHKEADAGLIKKEYLQKLATSRDEV